VELVGAAPHETSCEVVGDASVGVYALFRSFLQVGRRAARGAFVGWRGDRLVEMKCAADRAPWIYVASFERARDARDFADAADVLLPSALARPFEAHAVEERVIAWHGIDAATALHFSATLEARPLR
jgi:hypothetical protein